MSLFSYDFHRLGLWFPSCFVIYLALYEIKKLLKTSLPSICYCKGLSISYFSKMLVIPIPLYMWRNKVENSLNFFRTLKPTPHHPVSLRGSTNIRSRLLEVFLRKGVFFSIWVLFHELSQVTGLKGKGEGIPFTPHYHFHPLYRHLEICRAVAAGSSPLRIASSRTRTERLWFPSASC